MSTPAKPRLSAVQITLAMVLDIALVILFATLGNREHDSGLSSADVASTAWPFLIGLLLGWLMTRSWRKPASIWPEGLVVVIVTVAAGMALRVLFTDGGAPLSFILVATGTLTLFLLLRRLVSTVIMRAAAPLHET